MKKIFSSFILILLLIIYFNNIIIYAEGSNLYFKNIINHTNIFDSNGIYTTAQNISLKNNIYFQTNVLTEKLILIMEKLQEDPYRTRNDKLYGKLINNNPRKVTFSPNIDDNTIFLFSDGPEEIRNLNTQCLLQYYENYEEHTLPTDKMIDFEFYHYNNASRSPIDNNIIVGILLKNTSSTKPASFTIYGSAFETMRIPRTEDVGEFKNEPLRIREDEKKKSIMCAKMQCDFFNSVESKNPKVITLKPNEIKFIMNIELPYFYRSNGKIRIKCSDNTILSRVVSAKYGETLETIWKNTENDTGKCSKGQFCGIVDYTEIDVNIKDMEVGEYILIGNYNRKRDYKKELNNEITYPKSYIEDDIFYPSNYNEYPKPKYRKEEGKDYFFGNFGVVYNIKLDSPESRNFVMYPFGHNNGTFANIVLYNNTWFATGEMEKKNNLVSFDSIIKIDKTKNEFKFVLPGGNCGGIKFKMVK